MSANEEENSSHTWSVNALEGIEACVTRHVSKGGEEQLTHLVSEHVRGLEA